MPTAYIIAISAAVSSSIAALSFYNMKIKAAQSNVANLENIKNSILSYEQRRSSDIEILSMKITSQGDRLTDHMAQNAKEHYEMNRVIESIEDKFSKIMASIAVLEDRACSK